MNWDLQIAGRARKALRKPPPKDRRILLAALDVIKGDPFSGDIKRLKNEKATWRRRVGSYRIFFDVDLTSLTVSVLDIARRTSTAY